jgi:hypothetical protein
VREKADAKGAMDTPRAEAAIRLRSDKRRAESAFGKRTGRRTERKFGSRIERRTGKNVGRSGMKRASRKIGRDEEETAGSAKPVRSEEHLRGRGPTGLRPGRYRLSRPRRLETSMRFPSCCQSPRQRVRGLSAVRRKVLFCSEFIGRGGGTRTHTPSRDPDFGGSLLLAGIEVVTGPRYSAFPDLPVR